MQILEIRQSLLRHGLAGWLLFDFRGSNPIARRISGIGVGRHMTRRWFAWIPAGGEPVWLHHAIEPQGECADGGDVMKRRKGGMIQASQRRLGRYLLDQLRFGHFVCH